MCGCEESARRSSRADFRLAKEVSVEILSDRWLHPARRTDRLSRARSSGGPSPPRPTADQRDRCAPVRTTLMQMFLGGDVSRDDLGQGLTLPHKGPLMPDLGLAWLGEVARTGAGGHPLGDDVLRVRRHRDRCVSSQVSGLMKVERMRQHRRDFPGLAVLGDDHFVSWNVSLTVTLGRQCASDRGHRASAPTQGTSFSQRLGHLQIYVSLHSQACVHTELSRE